MLRGYFEDLPPELEEAGLIDGASSWTAFRLIALPLVAPGLVATTLFAFIFTWNEFLFALLLTRRAGSHPDGHGPQPGRRARDPVGRDRRERGDRHHSRRGPVPCSCSAT